MTEHIKLFLEGDKKTLERIEVSNNFSSENDTEKENNDSDTEIEGITLDYKALSMLSFIRIDSVFSDTGYTSFKHYSLFKGITLLSEIDRPFIYEYSSRVGVGRKKVKAVIETLNNTIKNKDNIDIKSIAILKINTLDFDKEIEYIFTDKKVRMFLDYCNENNLKMISDINEKVFDDIAKIKGFGITKVNLIKSIFDDYIIKAKEDKMLEENFIFEVSKKWYKILKDIKISVIADILDLDFSVKVDLKLCDIQRKRANKFKEEKEDIINLVNKINSLKTVGEIFESLKISDDKKFALSEKELTYIKYKIEDGFTLEKIGSKFGLTRERIRQIISRGIRKIDNALKKNDMNRVLRLSFPLKSFCYIDELFELVDDENSILIKAMIRFDEVNSIKKYTSLGIIYFDSSKDLSIINDFIYKLPDTIKLNDYIEEIRKVLEKVFINNIGIENIEMLLTEQGFKNYGEYYSRSNITFLNAFEIIFKDYIKEPLCMDEEGYRKVRDICKKYLCFEFTSSIRAVDARIRDSEVIILVDKKTYQHIENLDFNKDVITYIDEKLTYELSISSVTSAKIINNKYSTVLQKYGVYNKYILYSLTAIYLEKYKIGKGNTLDISLHLENLKKTREEQILEIIELNEGFVKIQDFIKITSWSLSKIDDILSKSYNVIKVGNAITSGEYLEISDSVRIKIKTLAKQYINKEGFVVTTLLFEDIIQDEKVLEFLRYYDIEKSDKISSIVKFLIPELKGNTLFLYTKNSKFKKFEDIILARFTKRSKFSDIVKFIDSYKIAPAARSKFINNIISNENYIKLSSFEIIRKDNLSITDSVVEKLLDFIEKEFLGKEYLSLKEVKDYKYQEELPSIEYEWNPYLMESVLSMNGYKNIERTFFDVGTERLVILKCENSINKFDELIYKILKNEYDGFYKEEDIYAFLVGKGVLYNNRKKIEKKLPFDLYKSDKFIIDEYGNVELV